MANSKKKVMTVMGSLPQETLIECELTKKITFKNPKKGFLGGVRTNPDKRKITVTPHMNLYFPVQSFFRFNDIEFPKLEEEQLPVIIGIGADHYLGLIHESAKRMIQSGKKIPVSH